MTSRLTLLLSYLLYLPLLPVLPWIIYQGKTVKRDTLRLPEASGIRSGTEPKLQQPPYGLLLRHIGESTVAGVGISSISNGLTACIARALAGEQLAVQWQAIAQSGIRAAQLKDIIAEEDKAPEQPPYQKALLLITLGVNDTTDLTPAHQWRRQLRQLIQHEKVYLPPETQVIFTQIPPMQNFPALPAPLNHFLGLRAWQLDKQIRHLCCKQGWHHAAISLPLQPQWMAEDGYHPNAEGYARWGEGVADNIRTLL